MGQWRSPDHGWLDGKSKKDYQNKLDAEFGTGEYKLLGDYNGCTKPARIRHRCGNVITTRPRFLLRWQATCKCLSGKGKYQTPDYNRKKYQTKLDETYGAGEYTLLKGYESYGVPTKIRHSCGKAFVATADSVMKGYACACIREVVLPPNWMLLDKRAVLAAIGVKP